MTTSAATARDAVSPIRSNVKAHNRSGTSGYEEMVSRGLALKERYERSLQKIDKLPCDTWPFGLGNQSAHPIEQMPNLKKRLGRGRTAKLRAQFNGKTETLEMTSTTPRKGSNREKRIDNTVRSAMLGRAVGDSSGCPASDILSGIANLDNQRRNGRSLPLNKISSYVILQELDAISTRKVKELLDVNDRQAQKYVKACEIALPFLARSLLTEDAQANEESQGDLAEAPKETIEPLEDQLDDWIQTGG
ncbi:hypothetical protein HXW73_09080 [Halomonas sp. SH5A2]|uniref:hypothetical protein n=1 Tax=Halomonas sp. SH5A2 TaxID=2749040 RepID=UPI00164165CC|nr:hypothetical protein [Halomonas sp. SH5A2]QNI03069.1 hypothetical protein HXW73_09080 [Halomonas sp. SH5A2]